MLSKFTSDTIRKIQITPDDALEVVQLPIGPMLIVASTTGVRHVSLLESCIPLHKPNKHTQAAALQLNQYFNRQIHEFSVPIDLWGHSPFSNKVWQELLKIPYGKTISYAQLAVQLGNKLCIRAAARANGRNPIPIIIPCHRVIGSDGSLTGFALGLEVKRKLLAIENPNKYLISQTTLNL